MTAAAPPSAVTQALAALGVRRLVVGIHDPAFPGLPGHDVGRGSPYSRGAERFLRFVRGLGFDGVQLGPQGQTSEVNSSPYDGTIFARNILSIDLHQLTESSGRAALLQEESLAALASSRPANWPRDRVPYRHAFAAQRKALALAFAAFASSRDRDVADRLARFQERHEPWLDRDAGYYAILGMEDRMNRRTHFGTGLEKQLKPLIVEALSHE